MNDTPRCDAINRTDTGAWINLARQLERELAEVRLKNTELVTHCAVAMTMLAGSISGRQYDPGWIRPKNMSLDEIRENCIQAYHYLHEATVKPKTP